MMVIRDKGLRSHALAFTEVALEIYRRGAGGLHRYSSARTNETADLKEEGQGAALLSQPGS